MSFHISRFTPAPLFSCFPLCFALGRARAPCLFVIYVPRMIYTWQYRIAQCICSDVDAFAHTNALRTFSTCKHTSYIQHTHVFIFTHTYKKIRDPQKTTVLVFVNDKALSPGTTLKKETIASKKRIPFVCHTRCAASDSREMLYMLKRCLVLHIPSHVHLPSLPKKNWKLAMPLTKAAQTALNDPKVIFFFEGLGSFFLCTFFFKGGQSLLCCWMRVLLLIF
jgi:hypothetical protein